MSPRNDHTFDPQEARDCFMERVRALVGYTGWRTPSVEGLAALLQREVEHGRLSANDLIDLIVATWEDFR